MRQDVLFHDVFLSVFIFSQTFYIFALPGCFPFFERLFHKKRAGLIGSTNTVKGDGTMKAYIEERVLGIANYILETGATVRSAAGKFKISKSTVHKDVTERLGELNPALARQVRQVLQKNMDERHIRGGEATRKRYCQQA
jgi:putative DeoR family transcriptional regulator (stage III sporulation protein D)